MDTPRKQKQEMLWHQPSVILVSDTGEQPYLKNKQTEVDVSRSMIPKVNFWFHIYMLCVCICWGTYIHTTHTFNKRQFKPPASYWDFITCNKYMILVSMRGGAWVCLVFHCFRTQDLVNCPDAFKNDDQVNRERMWKERNPSAAITATPSPQGWSFFKRIATFI